MTPTDVERARELQEAVNIAIGHASMCWNPRPGGQVFDTTEAEKVSVTLHTFIEKALTQARHEGRREGLLEAAKVADEVTLQFRGVFNDDIPTKDWLSETVALRIRALASGKNENERKES